MAVSPQAMPERFLSPRELADLLGVSREGIYRMVAEGMPVLRISTRRLRFRLSNVLAWLEERRG